MAKIDIGKFVNVYVSTALDLVEERKDMPFSEFEKIVRRRVSRKMLRPKKYILHLHHCFHWTFFLRGDESPFRYIQSKERDSVSMVALNGKPSDKSALVNYILENYKEPYLTTR